MRSFAKLAILVGLSALVGCTQGGVKTGGAAGGGSTGAGGVGGGDTTTCSFTAEGTLSPAIPTVGIVTWSTTLSPLTSAEIQFGLTAPGSTMTAPVDLTQPNHRTLLLMMKPLAWAAGFVSVTVGRARSVGTAPVVIG